MAQPVPSDSQLSDDERRRRARADACLFEAWLDSGDQRARGELVERFLPLARSLALRYKRTGEPLEDLVQVASLALVKAIDRYDPARGHAFSSFAVPTIVGEIKRHFRDRTWAVRPPRELQELTLRVEAAMTRLTGELDRSPTAGEIAAAVGVDVEQVLEALQARSGRGAVSLQTPQGDAEGGMTLGDTIGRVDPGIVQAEARAALDEMLRTVPARSREMLRLRFEEDMTQAEIGAVFGVSQMQVSRILRQTIADLRDAAGDARSTAAP
ncbi:MAG TPA: SigB/SigF/SigG family RNA polymerase sigma factor [Solirubrobacteraceae bacterium]|nr:SigB/SigF/SigG family RNA polymerase sigma factor [Solirubrobacteraceae bacterium]